MREPPSPEGDRISQPTDASLGEVHGSVPVPRSGSRWRGWLAVSGPAIMISVGYMDPGNWATDIAGGSRYEYRLLWVLLMSNVMAVLLQSLAVRLGIARRRDLAQASRETYPAAINLPLYLLAEIAIAACDLAEVLGSAIALQLLFGLPLLAGVIITTLDVVLLLALTRFGIRKLEAIVLSLVGTIGLAFLAEIILARPDWGLVAQGFRPSLPDSGALYIAIGILGATVMPHNLYLHSALVQTRRFVGGGSETRRAIRLNTIDSALALNLAFLVNAAILIMGAAVFYRHGYHEVARIQDAHRLLQPIVGVALAPIAFAVALLAAGQSSTVTGTLAGQVVMEGYLDIRIRPWVRRLLTRLLAVVPAAFVILHFGEASTGSLLVLSQVILSLQLPFATIPLIHFVSDRRRMGDFAIGPRLKILSWTAAAVIVGLNVKLVVDEISGWLGGGGAGHWLVHLLVLPVCGGLALLLLWVTFEPWIQHLVGWRPHRPGSEIHREPPGTLQPLQAAPPVRRVAIALDFSGRDRQLLAESLRFLPVDRPRLRLLHVVESPSARVFGAEAADREAGTDVALLERCADAVRALGFDVTTALGAGDPARELARLAGEFEADLVILGGHGHRGFSDVIYGTTAEALRHRVRASVLVIPLAK